MNKTLFFTAFIAISFFIKQISASQPPLQVPPGDIPIENTPMFISLGFDDNSHSGMSKGTEKAGGIKWVVDFTKDLVNPTGLAQEATFDGTPVRCTFYSNTFYFTPMNGDFSELVKWATNYAYRMGHEIGNHTHSHITGKGGASLPVSSWEAEIIECNDWFTKPAPAIEDSTNITPNNNLGAGIDPKDIVGLRSPYLFYGDATFTACKNQGILYDCSIEEGLDPSQDGTNFYWPYTLDHASPGHKYMVEVAGTKDQENLVPNHPDVWELPCYAVVAPTDDICDQYGIPSGFRQKLKDYFTMLGKPGAFDAENGKITGLDYNWFYFHEYNLSKAEALAVLKYTLDLRMQGNRAPMLLGVHSQFYTDFWNGNASQCPISADRREVIEQFVDYALETYSDVRIVTMKNVMEWCKNPVSLRPNTATISKAKQSTTQNIIVKGSRVQLRSKLPVTASLYNISGKKISEKKLKVVNGLCKWNLEKSFAAGSYIVRMQELSALVNIE